MGILKSLINKVDNYITSKLNNANDKIINANEYLIKTAFLHQQTFTRFKNLCYGKKIVVCGPGPSLNNYKPIKDAVHIALNRAFLFDKVHFDFIFSQDYRGISMVKNEIKEYPNCIKLFGQTDLNVCNIPEDFSRECNALRFNLDTGITKNGYKSKFVKDIDYSPIGGFPVVGISVMQFALYMNPTDIYLVGLDMSGSHFSNKNQSKEDVEKDIKDQSLFWENEFEHQIKIWEYFKTFKDSYYPNVSVHSINPVGLKGMFDDIYQ